MSTTEKMKSVKAAWVLAPDGPKKEAAFKYLQAAEKAHASRNHSRCISALNAVTDALA